MTRTTIFLLFLFLINVAVAQEQVKDTAYDVMLKTLLAHSVDEVSVEEADSSGSYFLDAREKHEYEVSHIKDALWVGYDDFNKSRVAHLDKNRPIVVYCSVGYRSEKVSEQLIEMGFTDVSNLYGGIFDWVNKKKPVVKEDGTETDDVHAYSKSWGIWLQRGNKVYNSPAATK